MEYTVVFQDYFGYFLDKWWINRGFFLPTAIIETGSAKVVAKAFIYSAIEFFATFFAMVRDRIVVCFHK